MSKEKRVLWIRKELFLVRETPPKAGSPLALRPVCTCLGSGVPRLSVRTWGPSNAG